MSNEKTKTSSLTTSGRARRRFLERSVLAAASTSAAAVLPDLAVASSRDVPQRSQTECLHVQTPMKNVEGKVAFVTGGASGIGLGIVKAMVGAGMKVVIADISEERIKQALAHFAATNQSDQLHAIRVNVTDRPGMEQAAAETVKVFGKVHVLVNNAGVALPPTLEQTSYKDFDWVMGVNVAGVFNGIHVFLPHLKAHGEGGQIISTASIMGLFSFGGGAYTPSKYAVVGMMEALRVELAQTGIGASVLCPGLVTSHALDNSLRERPQDQKLDAKADAQVAERDRRYRNDPEFAMDPFEVGQLVLRGMRNNDLYILTSPEYEQIMRDRSEALIASIPRDLRLTKTRLATARSGFPTSIYAVEIGRRRCALAGRGKAKVPQEGAGDWVLERR